MPSSQTSKPVLKEKTSEVRRQQALAGGKLSQANKRHLDMLERWLKLAGQDVVIVIESPGAVSVEGDAAPKPRLIEVTDMNAANLFSLADKSGDTIRLASEKETKAYREYEAALTAHAKKLVTDQAAQLAQNLVRSVTGMDVAPLSRAADAEPPTPPDIQPTERRDPAEMTPELPELPGADAGESTAEGTDSAQFLTSVGGLKAETIAAIRAAGFVTVESLAEVAPDALAKAVNGVGPKTAAKIVVAASEAVSANE